MGGWRTRLGRATRGKSSVVLARGGDQVPGVAAEGELFDQRARAGELGLVIGDEGGDGGVGARRARVGGRARRALGDEKTLDASETSGDALGVTLDETIWRSRRATSASLTVTAARSRVTARSARRRRGDSSFASETSFADSLSASSR